MGAQDTVLIGARDTSRLTVTTVLPAQQPGASGEKYSAVGREVSFRSFLWLPLELFLQGAAEVCYPSWIPSAFRKEWPCDPAWPAAPVLMDAESHLLGLCKLLTQDVSACHGVCAQSQFSENAPLCWGLSLSALSPETRETGFSLKAETEHPMRPCKASASRRGSSCPLSTHVRVRSELLHLRYQWVSLETGELLTDAQ